MNVPETISLKLQAIREAAVQEERDCTVIDKSRRTGRTTKALQEVLQCLRRDNDGSPMEAHCYVVGFRHEERYCRDILRELGATTEEQKLITILPISRMLEWAAGRRAHITTDHAAWRAR